MRQNHRAGEKVFVDYAGQHPTLVDPTTGAVTEVELFVWALGARSATSSVSTLHPTAGSDCANGAPRRRSASGSRPRRISSACSTRCGLV
ncbi:protein of unknown function [Candidatus Methylomirabilis oxygeniifera]|uniref:Uncharacterized protein n=1 Tax=Methylomirabilis oxygeniifera TaxID=671143 RepID=D5MHH6_METO1|nr:protein of unknown function [Candidatus Methylomirabilis oxyfera]